jgi:hypothetical protein
MLLETLFKEPFPSYSPKWLKKANGTSLFYDGFNEKLNLAFEHNGEQHYKQTKWFHKSKTDFLNNIENDRIKKEISDKRGIFLLIIPYNVEFVKIPDFVILELKKIGFLKIPKIPNPLKLQTFSKSNYNKLKEVCEERGGRLLSEFWLGTHNKHEIECKKGHRWGALPLNVMRGTWCPECKPERIGKSNLRKDGDEFLIQLAESKNGIYIYKQYSGLDSKYEWKCKKGHIFISTASDIKKGTWCSECTRADRIKTEMMEIYKIAEKNGGACLSFESEYENQKSLLLFECKDKHRFYLKAGNIKNRGSWCRICARSKRRTINDNKTKNDRYIAKLPER